MAAAKFKRGDVVQRPDAWQPRFPKGRPRKGRAIVIKGGTRAVTLCTFQPGAKVGTPGNPHVGNYLTKGMVRVGHVKKMPKVCASVLKWKTTFWAQHPHFTTPTALAGRRRKRARR
jgi:hypothetical protein